MTRFEARQQADIYPRADPEVLGDLLSLVLAKNPLLPPPPPPPPPSTPTNDIPVTTTVGTNFPVVTTTVITTGNDGQPTTVIRTNTEAIVLPTTSTNANDHDHNPGATTRTGGSVPNHITTTPPGSNKNGGAGTSTARNPAGGRSTVLSESAPGVALKASLAAASKGCAMSSCDWQFGTTTPTKTTGIEAGSTGSSSPTSGGSGDRGDNSNKLALIGGIVGAIVGTVLLLLSIYFLVRRARRRRDANLNGSDLDATGLLSDGDPFRSMGNRQSRMTIDTGQLHRSPSFGTLYGLRYNPDLGQGNHAPLSPLLQWKPFTPSVGPESPICPNSPSRSGSDSDTTQAQRHSVIDDLRPSAGDRHDRSPSLSVAAVVLENPFAAEADPPERGDGTASEENLDVNRTIISQSSGSDYSISHGDPNC